MITEFEAKFLSIDKDEVRKRFGEKGATLLRPEFEQTRVNFHLPGEKRQDDAWLRVRDEGDKVTLSLKMILGKNIEDQKETSVIVSDFDTTTQILQAIGCERKVFQQTKRELWKFGEVDLTIDTWPGLAPFVEIEGPSEMAVQDTARLLEFEYAKAVFGSASIVYKMHYGISLDEIEKLVGEITFGNEKLKNLQPRN